MYVSSYLCAMRINFPPSTSVFPCQYHSTNAPYSSSSTRCSYKDKGMMRGNLPKSNAFSEIGKYWIKKDFHILVPWHRRLVAEISPRRPAFSPVSVHVWFVVDSGTGTRFLRVLRFSPVIVIPPMLYTPLHVESTLTSSATGRSLGTLKKQSGSIC
jgi:hypothetical protein